MASVPILFPATTFSFAPEPSATPPKALPEITFPSSPRAVPLFG